MVSDMSSRKRKTQVEIMLVDIRKAIDDQQWPRYQIGRLLQYLESYDPLLDEVTKDFLKNVDLVNKGDLEALREKNLDLVVRGDPIITYYWPAILPRLLFKLIHVFGYPIIRESDGGKTMFSYLFKYKGHIIEVRDFRGSLVILHMTPYPVEKGPFPEDIPPQDGAKEVLEEFADNLMRLVMNATPLGYEDRTVYL